MTQEILGRYSPSFPRADECTAFQEEVSDHLWDLEFTLRGLALRCKGDPQWDGEITPPVRDFLGNLQAVVAQVEVAIDQFFGRSSRAGMVYLGPWRRIPEEADLAKVSRASDRPEMRFWASLFDDQTRTEVNRWLARFECDIEIDKRQQIDRDLIFRRLREVWNGPLEEPDSVLES